MSKLEIIVRLFEAFILFVFFSVFIFFCICILFVYIYFFCSSYLLIYIRFLIFQLFNHSGTEVILFHMIFMRHGKTNCPVYYGFKNTDLILLFLRGISVCPWEKMHRLKISVRWQTTMSGFFWWDGLLHTQQELQPSLWQQNPLHPRKLPLWRRERLRGRHWWIWLRWEWFLRCYVILTLPLKLI